MTKNKNFTPMQKESYRQYVFKVAADYQKSLPAQKLRKYREMMFQEWLIKVGAIDIPNIEEWAKEQSKKHR